MGGAVIQILGGYCHRGSAHHGGQALRCELRSGLAIRRGAAGQLLIAGVLVGVAVENNHQQQKRREESIRYWRWANNIDNIEQQMVKDGWKL